MRRPRAAAVGSLAGAGLIGGALLLHTLPPLPDTLSMTATLRWWETVGTPSAAMTLVHLGAIALTCWLTATGMVGLGLSIGSSSVHESLWRLMTTRSLRRLVGGGALVMAVAGPSAVAAQDEPVTLAHDLTLGDRGPAVDDPIVLTDVGPVDRPAPGDPLPEPTEAEHAMATPDTWTVERGDHLWHIAEETLVDRGRADPEPAAVHGYWVRLIDANRDVVGDDPDLVHPGQVLQLPG